MTDFLVSQTNAAALSADVDWQSQTPHASTTGSPVQAPVQGAEEAGELDLREALEWLLGSPEPQEEELHQEELAARQERRMDLILWLMNLELRLSPYSELA